jgi:hypothetical protein
MLQYSLQIYQSAGNRRPFSEWLDELDDRQAHAKAYLQDYQNRTAKARAPKRLI